MAQPPPRRVRCCTRNFLLLYKGTQTISSSAFPYKLAAIDLDDTLLGPDKQISADNVLAVQKLREAGVRIVLASGRRHENMLRFHRLLTLQGPIISCQGALARDAETGDILHKHFMDADLAAQVVRDGTERGMTQMVYDISDTLARERTPFTDLYEFRTGSKVMLKGDLTQLAGDTPQKIIWVCDADQAQTLLPLMQAQYRGQLEVLISDPEYLEFMADGVSKAVGLEAVARRYGIAQAETLAFGDGNNDVTMIRWAGLGVAMDHARPSAQAVADLIAPPGSPESSFARAVQSILARHQQMPSPPAPLPKLGEGRGGL